MLLVDGRVGTDVFPTLQGTGIQILVEVTGFAYIVIRWYNEQALVLFTEQDDEPFYISYKYVCKKYKTLREDAHLAERQIALNGTARAPTRQSR